MKVITKEELYVRLEVDALVLLLFGVLHAIFFAVAAWTGALDLDTHPFLGAFGAVGILGIWFGAGLFAFYRYEQRRARNLVRQVLGPNESGAGASSEKP